MRHATIVQVRQRKTTHGGATPDIDLFHDSDDKVNRHLDAIVEELRDNHGAGVLIAGFQTEDRKPG